MPESNYHARITRAYRDLVNWYVRCAWRYPATKLLLVFGFLCASAWLVYLAPTDVARYQCYALAFWRGGSGLASLASTQCAFLHVSLNGPALHTLPLEYPPLALLVFSAPLLAPMPYYSLVFANLMTLVAILISWLLGRYQSRKAMSRYLWLLALGGGALFQLRYDLLPSLGMLLCLIAAERRYWRAAYVALAIVTLLKIFPLVALPALIIAERRDHVLRNDASAAISARQRGDSAGIDVWVNTALYGALVLAVTGVFSCIGGLNATLESLRYIILRPSEIESMQSSVAWLAHLAGAPLTVVSTYGSINSIGPFDRQIGWAAVCLFVAGSSYTLWLQWRGKTSLGQTMIALLCWLIVTGKVLSPQYLLWIIPLIAYVGAPRWWLWMWALMSLVSSGAYIVYFGQLSNAATAAHVLQTLPGFLAVTALRNLMLLLLTIGPLVHGRHVGEGDLPQRTAYGTPTSEYSRLIR